MKYKTKPYHSDLLNGTFPYFAIIDVNLIFFYGIPKSLKAKLAKKTKHKNKKHKTE